MVCTTRVLEGSQPRERVTPFRVCGEKTLLLTAYMISPQVFFMQSGFAMLCAGCVRKKNVVNSMLKNLLAASAAAIAFYLVGFGLAFGDNEGSEDVGNYRWFSDFL